MNAHDQWALYLDPDTHPDVKAEIASDLDEQDTAALDRVGGILADEAVWGGPSAGLREQLLAQARSEKESTDDSPPDSPTPSPVDEVADRRSLRSAGWIGGGLVAAAAAVVALMFVVPPADDANITTYELAATPLTPNLDATVDVEPLPAGVAITLNIRGLPPAEEGTYYAAWLMSEGTMAGESMGDDAMAGDTTGDDAMEDGDAAAGEGSMGDAPMVGVGSFHWREGGIPIELWSGVDTERFPIFMVTLQDEDAPPIASDVVVITGRLTEG